MSRLVLIAAAALALAACGEKPQTLGENQRRDQPAFQGTGLAFQAPGWKAGDRGAWEQQLKGRAQGQNEYVRVN
ncbi:MAG: hypothetical protein ACXWC2_13865 [Ramlibacter sp.]